MNEKIIDYLQYNLLVSKDDLQSRSKPITPIRNYKKGYLQPNGTRIYTGNVMSDKALHILSGETLQNMRVNGITNEDYLEKILTQGASVTRLDLAITQYITDDLLTPMCFRDFAMRGQIVSSHADYGARYIASVGENYNDNIETLYIGDIKNRGKKGIVRVYDKGFEMDLDRYLITRIEIEDKRDKAHTSAKRIVKGHSISEVIKTRFDVNNYEWQNLLDADSIDTSRGKSVTEKNEKNENANRWQWLIDKVAPAVAKSLKYDIDNGNGTGNLDMFNDAIARNYEKL